MASTEGQTFAMPKKSALVADLFTTQEQRDNDRREKVMDIPIAEIDDFPNQPFQVKMDEAMTAMVESVKAVGIQTPAIARQKENGRYELISGHRRKTAATLAGLKTMPVIVRPMSRDEAIIALVDANLQREIILPSEKAKSYQMKLEAMKRQQGERTDLTCVPLGHKLENKRSREVLAENSPDSNTQIQRFIRLNDLIPEILQMVDDGKIAFRPAVELSYLPAEQQTVLLDTMQSEDSTPSLAQAIKMKSFSQNGKLNDEVILSILSEEKPNQIEQFKIPKDRLSKYFPTGTPTDKIQDTIIKALELWRQRERNRDAR
jgi:ParB family chromosome partitioning protein